MRRALYPGTFDPLTRGHLNIVEKASRLYDEVIVGLATFTGKDSLFSLEERFEMVRESCAGFDNVRVMTFDGMVVRFARDMECCVMIRGMRAVSDFEYELSLAMTNNKLDSGIETVFMVPALKYMYLSSSMVRQIAELGGELIDFVTPNVIEALTNKLHHPAKGI